MPIRTTPFGLVDGNGVAGLRGRRHGPEAAQLAGRVDPEAPLAGEVAALGLGGDQHQGVGTGDYKRVDPHRSDLAMIASISTSGSVTPTARPCSI